MANVVAQFNSSIRTGVSPLTVNFTNTSTGPYTSPQWSFSDGTQSFLINPSHTFVTDGVWTVTLTVFDEVSGTSQASTTISVFADDNYSTSSTTQQALFANKRFNPGQVSVRKTVVDGSMVETQWPMSSATNFNVVPPTTTATVWPFSGRCRQSGDPLKIGLETIGINLFGSRTHNYISLFVNTGTTEFSNTSLSGSEVYMYKAASIGTNSALVDRPLPNISSGVTCRFIAFNTITGGTSADTLSNSSTHQSLQCSPAIDSLGTLDIPDMYQANNSAGGLLSYLEGSSSVGMSKLFIHPTYSGWNTVEKWKPSSVRLVLPFVMWHNKTTPGVTLIDSAVMYRDDETNLKYSNLTIENNGTVVGRAFHEKKLLVIDDVELQASLNWLSNRNYSLPAPIVSQTSTVDSTGGLQTGVTYYITYRVRDAAGVNFTGGTAFGNGDIQPLHCRYIQELTPTTSGYKFNIQAPASNFYVTSVGAAMTGFTASVVDVLIGSATTGSIGDAVWHYSGNVGTYENLVSGIEVPYTVGTKTEPSFVGMNISGNTTLAFGDDPFLMGYFSALSQSTIYKMSTTCVAKNNEFNATQNPTFNETLNESVYISEVALYNENNELLMTGKLNTPIEKNDKKFVTIKMELDL